VINKTVANLNRFKITILISAYLNLKIIHKVYKNKLHDHFLEFIKIVSNISATKNTCALIKGKLINYKKSNTITNEEEDIILKASAKSPTVTLFLAGHILDLLSHNSKFDWPPKLTPCTQPRMLVSLLARHICTTFFVVLQLG
jgi:hypothetical protein